MKGLIFGMIMLAHHAVTAVPVYVMLSLTSINSQGQLSDKAKLQSQLQSLKSSGVKGVMGDVWWGLTEPSPKNYAFDGYVNLVETVKQSGLQFIPVMSFHECGGNVGDSCSYPLPSFVTAVGASNNNIWYHDRDGVTTTEYISLFADNQAVFGGRTPIQMYGDFMNAFSVKFASYMGNTIPEIQVGLGPAGELRYPSYPLSKWAFCGIGEFQSYGEYAAQSLSTYIKGKTDGGSPSWSGTYNDKPPSNVCFFQQNCQNSGFQPAGQQYLKWYTSSLVAHGDAVMEIAASAFGKFSGTTIAGKVSGVHWWAGDSSRAAEATAGYNMLNGNNAYSDIANMLKRHNAGMVFTCFEMRDSEQSSSCASKPEELVQTVHSAADNAGIKFSAENALPRYDNTAYDTIVAQSSTNLGKPERFTYLRLCDDLMNQLGGFSVFVNRMNGLGGTAHYVEVKSTTLYTTKDTAFFYALGALVVVAVLMVAALVVIKTRRGNMTPLHQNNYQELSSSA